MNVAKKLMKVLPDLKIIHLVRDPRPMLWSWKRMKQCEDDYGGSLACTNRLCSRLENDIQEVMSSDENIKSRIKTVFYEDFARNPLDTAKDLYDFIGYDFTDDVRDFVYNLTMAGLGDNMPFNTQRANSSAHINDWKTYIEKDFLEIIQTRCDKVLKYLNYDFYNLN